MHEFVPLRMNNEKSIVQSKLGI